MADDNFVSNSPSSLQTGAHRVLLRRNFDEEIIHEEEGDDGPNRRHDDGLVVTALVLEVTCFDSNMSRDSSHS